MFHQLFYWKGSRVILASVNPRNSAAKWLWKDHSCGKTNVKKGSFMLLLGPLKIVALCLPIGARNRGIERDRKGISVLQLLQHHHFLVRDSWQPMNQLTILSLDPWKSCHLRQGGWTHFGPSERVPPCRRFARTRVWQVAASKVPDCRHFGASWPCCSSSSSWMVQGLREWLHHWIFTLGEYWNVVNQSTWKVWTNNSECLAIEHWIFMTFAGSAVAISPLYSWFITKSESYSPDVRRRRRRTTTKAFIQSPKTRSPITNRSQWTLHPRIKFNQNQVATRSYKCRIIFEHLRIIFQAQLHPSPSLTWPLVYSHLCAMQTSLMPPAAKPESYTPSHGSQGWIFDRGLG